MASIHLIALTIHRSQEVLDLDVFPAYYLTVIALIVASCAIAQTTGLQTGKGLAVFAAFVALVWAGAVAFAVGVGRGMLRISARIIPALDVDLDLDAGNCEEVCAGVKLAMRSGQHAEPFIIPSIFTGHARTINVVLAVLLSFWLAFNFAILHSSSSRTDPSHPDPESSITSELSHDHLIKERRSLRWNSRNGLMAAVTFAMVLTWVILGELFMKELPCQEGYDAVGQWGPIVGFALAVVAVLVGARKENKDSSVVSVPAKETI